MFQPETLAKSHEVAQRWEDQFQRIGRKLGGGAWQGRSHSGLPLKAAYFPHDISGIDFADIAAPGEYPFTRGNLATQYQFMNWANQPVIGYGLPEHTRARMDLLAAQGMTGYFGRQFYNLVYDLVSHEGLDPDHPAARGRIGQCGMAVYSVADMERLFHGLSLRDINVVHITYYQVIPALAQFIAYAERRGVAPHELRGNSMNWYHQSAYVGMSAFPPQQGLKLAVALTRYCAEHMPRWNTTNFFGYGIEEAGGTAIQEIGLMLAFGIEFVRACQGAGVAPQTALERFGFQIAQANDFFEEVCKVRALRQIWAKTMRTHFGVQTPAALHVRIHTHTSGACLTAQQPLVNLIRTTLHAFGAALAGTQSMEVSSYDEALSIPTPEAATLALRVQQVIQEETNITQVADPLAGSYYVEALTAQIANEALKLAEAIEEHGGYIAAQQAGWIRREVESSAARWRDAVDAGSRKVVGLNCFQTEKPEQPAIFQVDPDTERIAIERVQDLRRHRDASRLEKALGALRLAAKEFSRMNISEIGDNALLLAAIETARADATTGEMMGVLKETLGWGAPHEF
jgi:methylmalonyl-CoA mutase N-terminal domain/subunit